MKNWEDLRYVLAVARVGTVSKAAETLHVNQSTVSRRINKFEEELKVRLFERLSTGYQLTNEGKTLVSFAERIENEMHTVEMRLSGLNEILEGTVRITAPPTLTVLLLTPIFAEFSKEYPNVELQVVASNNIQNISQREADIAIRVSHQPPPEHLVAKELGQVQFGVFGLDEYLESYYQDCERDNTTPLMWIGEDNTQARPSWLPTTLKHLKLALRTNDPLVTIETMHLGLGVGRLPLLARRKHHRLQEFKVENSLPTKPLWLITHPELRKTKRLMVLLEFITDRVREALKFQ